MDSRRRRSDESNLNEEVNTAHPPKQDRPYRGRSIEFPSESNCGRAVNNVTDGQPIDGKEYGIEIR